MAHMTSNDTYGSVGAGRDFWATNVQKVQHVGTSGDFIFQANHFLSTPTFKTQVVLGRDWKKIGKKIFLDISKITCYSCIFSQFHKNVQILAKK